MDNFRAVREYEYGYKYFKINKAVFFLSLFKLMLYQFFNLTDFCQVVKALCNVQ